MRNNPLVILSLMVLLVSCDSNSVFDEYQSVESAWDKDKGIEFRITPPDTVNPYNLFINLRNTNDYRYNNLFLLVEMHHPNGKVKKDTLEYRMTAPDGRFLGSGFSDLKENKLWYKKSEVFREVGEYRVIIFQAMREVGEVNGVESLEGIIDVGFRVERPENEN